MSLLSLSAVTPAVSTRSSGVASGWSLTWPTCSLDVLWKPLSLSRWTDCRSSRFKLSWIHDPTVVNSNILWTGLATTNLNAKHRQRPGCDFRVSCSLSLSSPSLISCDPELVFQSRYLHTTISCARIPPVSYFDKFLLPVIARYFRSD